MRKIKVRFRFKTSLLIAWRIQGHFFLYQEVGAHFFKKNVDGNFVCTDSTDINVGERQYTNDYRRSTVVTGLRNRMIGSI